MALSKGNNRGTSSMTDLLLSGIDNGSERIVMSLDPAAMGKIMDRLTDLYTDPILATVREVISNALDATAVSRTNGLDPNPVKITLPNQFEPEFVVEDNGVGMSREIIKDIFAKYGASTKEDNFNQVGAFGLGAKSPLAYCEEFYFTTTRDGVTSEVAVTRLDTGPETNILSITDTGNPSGTIMRVPVRNTDYDFLNFKNAAESYQKHAFTMDEPIIVNGVEYFGNEDFYQFDDIEIEPELNIAGRVWMNKNNLERISAMIDSQYEASISPKIGYVISGFLYRDPAGNKSYEGNGEYEPDLIVELKPGVVEFSSSRDEIMKDTRFDYFNKLVKGQISNPSYFFGNLIKFYKTIENNSEAYKILYSFNYKFEDDKVIFAKEVPEYINKVGNVSHHEVSVSELTTNNGYNPVAENKKFENDNVFVGVLYPLVHDDKKFNLIDLRRPYVQNSEIGRRKEAKVKNIESPSVSEANTRFAGTLYSNEKVSLLDSIDVLKNENVQISNTFNSRELCFIENVSTDKEIALIIRNRSNSEKRHNYVLVNGSISEEMKNALKDRLGVDNEHGITYHTVNSFIDSAKAFKKSLLMRRAVAKVAEGDDFIVNGVVIDPFNTVEDIYSFETPYRYSSPVNVQDLINENALFIPMKRFATRSIAPIINGLYHAEGSVVFNRPVVAIIDPNKDFFETVKEASSYAVGKDYKIRSKVAEDRLAGRIFDRDTLIDQVAEIDQDFKVAVHYLKSLYHITPRLYVRDYSVGGARESQNPIVRDLEMVENLISHSSYSPNLQSIADFLKSVLAKDFSEWKIDAPSRTLLVGLGEEEIKAYNDKLNIIRIFVSGNAYYADKKEKELQKIHEAFLHTKDNGLRSAVSDRVESIIEEINNIDKGDENE